MIFSIVPLSVYIPTNSVQEFPLFTSSPVFIIPSFFYNNHLKRYYLFFCFWVVWEHFNILDINIPYQIWVCQYFLSSHRLSYLFIFAFDGNLKSLPRSMCSSRSFIEVLNSFWVDFCVWCKILVQFHSFTYDSPVFSTSFIKESIPSSLYVLGFFVVN